MASPLHTVKARFGSKEDLVSKLAPLLDRGADESETDFRERLLRVSNRKLVKLWEREQSLRGKFQSREGLVDAILGLESPGKVDQDRRRKLLALGTGRLLALHDTQARRARKA